jgi:TolB-like protein/cytochrome c-type biogenesis protein CcmH/NrfG
MGDGALVEFASVVDAVECAIRIQRGVTKRNADIPDNKRIVFRIGVNLGDIIIEGDDIYGDGVNVAARLEGEADPGGICISGDAYRQVLGKLDYAFEDIGERDLKNIAQPVRAYRLQPDAGSSPKIALQQERRQRPVVIASVVVIIAALIAGGLYAWLERSQSNQTNEATLPSAVADVEAVPSDKQVSTLPNNPSIAVLAFQNMSDDPNQEYFADGIAEDLITDLSKLSALFVSARNSSFQYKGQAIDIKRVGRELGVRYVVEGSVRRSGNQVRITAQLIDAETGGHVWAERYDGSLDDVFALQDRVTGQIIDALKVQLTPSERIAVDTHGTYNPLAYDAYLRGLGLLAERKYIDTEGNAAAQATFEEAIRLDPDYAQAYAGLSWAKWLYIASIRSDSSENEVFDLAEKSLALNDNALARRTLAKKYFAPLGLYGTINKSADLAVVELEAAKRLQPNDPDVLADLATALSFAGRPGDALTLIKKAMELNPSHPDWSSWDVPYAFLASAYGLAGQAEAAKTAWDRHRHLLRGAKRSAYSMKRQWPMAPAEEEKFFRGLEIAGAFE